MEPSLNEQPDSRPPALPRRSNARARRRRLTRLGSVLLVALVAAGCATAPDRSDREAYAEYRAINDPLEPLNRVVFDLNQALDAMFLRPWAEFYRILLPPPMREGIGNVLSNLRSPVVLVNDLLQAEWERAGTTTGRFLINSTLGVGGIGDPATDFGLDRHNEDFGQTLAVWGLPEGPFLMLPVLGPSNPRDATGFVVDSFLIDPLGAMTTFGVGPDSLSYVGNGRSFMTAVDTRSRAVEELDDLKKSSLDYYAAIRSLYRQFRVSEIHQGRPPPDAGPTLEAFPAIPEQ